MIQVRIVDVDPLELSPSEYPLDPVTLERHIAGYTMEVAVTFCDLSYREARDMLLQQTTFDLVVSDER